MVQELSNAVSAFMEKAGQTVPSTPTVPNEALAKLRYMLNYEECDENKHASGLRDAWDDTGNRIIKYHPEHFDMVEVADSLGDMLYVVMGAALAFGIDMVPVMEEIQRSNMSKFIDGHEDENGKWIKGPSYSPANLRPIIEAQMKGSR